MNDDGVALDLLLHDDGTPLMNIDPEQTLDPTPNDPLTSTVPSPTNSQSSHAPLLKIVDPFKNDLRSTTPHYDDRDYNLKYARKLKRESTVHDGLSHELVLENSSNIVNQ